jgi:hypothetical protein
MLISEHDPLCPWQTRTCECPLIERVKEREGERYNWGDGATIRAKVEALRASFAAYSDEKWDVLTDVLDLIDGSSDE